MVCSSGGKQAKRHFSVARLLGMSDDEDFDADNSDSDFEYRQTCCYCCGPGFSVSVRTAVDTLPADIFQDL